MPNAGTYAGTIMRFFSPRWPLWSLGMYQRRWAGPGREYPIEEDDTLRHVTAARVSPELAGQTDPVTGVPLDEISTAADGAEGLLVNAMRMHGRRILELLDDPSWLGDVEAQVELPVLEAASLHAQALVPRAMQPTRLVHSLLPVDGMTIRQTAQSCVDGQLWHAHGVGAAVSAVLQAVDRVRERAPYRNRR